MMKVVFGVWALLELSLRYRYPLHQVVTHGFAHACSAPSVLGRGHTRSRVDALQRDAIRTCGNAASGWR